MPPKKQNVGASVKKQQKVIEDKTFGLKNKNKSKKVQQYVQSVSRTPQQIAAEKAAEARRAAKRAQEAMEHEMSIMFKTVQKQVKQGMDPKSVLCEYFKQGICVRGAKCKFSHDAAQVRKVAKLDMYTDPRFTDASDERTNKTDIICKFFLDAVESKKYGALWICPNNGKDCQYNHALPQGFVLQRDRKLIAEQQEDGVTIEEQIEIERAGLLRRNDLTPVTKETFEKWKIAQKEKVEQAVKDKVKAAMDKKALGKLAMAAGLSGRDLFTFDPSLFVDDLDAADNAEMEIRETGNDDDEVEDGTSSALASVVDRNLFMDDDEELPQIQDSRTST